DDFGFGINLDAIAINFEKRGIGTTPDTFGFRVFRIASGDANAHLVEPAIEDVLLSSTGLSLPTSTALEVASPSNTNNGASGTAIFTFDNPLLLEPGV